eukprot:TRINITY_DN9001_c0_g1_i3.p3 TRINITY_DN9001_c0_g1~~TRINITY_DN9001_c0_g1_i3.p3  ORF type:complete len:114 (+),score=19.14 TRINITY_DN9001_c0_g1_i3:264-605(+)
MARACVLTIAACSAVPGGSLSEPLVVELFDQDLVSDDFIGDIDLPLHSILGGAPINDWFTILNKDRNPAGQLHLAVQAVQMPAVCRSCWWRANGQHRALGTALGTALDTALGT